MRDLLCQKHKGTMAEEKAEDRPDVAVDQGFKQGKCGKEAGWKVA